MRWAVPFKFKVIYPCFLNIIVLCLHLQNHFSCSTFIHAVINPALSRINIFTCTYQCFYACKHRKFNKTDLKPNYLGKELSLCHKLWFYNPYIYGTQRFRPEIFQTVNSVRSNNLSLKYQYQYLHNLMV